MKLMWTILALAALANFASADVSFESFKTIPNGLGVNIHFTHPDGKELDRLAAAGFKFVRMDFTWSATEKADGNYDFSNYDFLLDQLDKHNIRAILILDYIHKNHDKNESPHTSEGRAAFVKWSLASVKHFQNRK